MAEVRAAPAGARGLDAAPHVRLTAKLAAAEAAVQALLAECQQPDVRATLEARRACTGAACGRDGSRRTPVRPQSAHDTRAGVTTRC